MKHYMNPEICILALEEEDVIVTSVSISNLTDCDYTSWDEIAFS